MIEHRTGSRALGALGDSSADLGFLLGPAVTSLTTVRIAAGDALPEPPAESWQLLHVLSGLVEVSGADGATLTLEPERAVQWEPGERRSSRALVDSLVVLVEATERIPDGRPAV